ncbi:hypothetical protein T440DRAFT_316636 [Plenodomus tracheiphilus IPT5]|uniref:Uncharacterized protein n=1 Tax=Plenodomus tracheiphilus IPT5 TaxID=1408161 RepID=A0A6A7AP43_9PLEO|nr:hypothetical protein T440DRAFT_316636 [Plenodomus tracheiphilus IPT5]
MCLAASDVDIRAHKIFAKKAHWNDTLATISVLTEDAQYPDGVGSRGSTTIRTSLFALARPGCAMEVTLRGHGSKRRPLTSPSPTHGSLRRYTQLPSRSALLPQQIRQIRTVVPSVILDVKPVERQGGLRRIAGHATLRPRTETLAVSPI